MTNQIIRNYYQNKKVAVSGGLGFIGYEVVKTLVDFGAQVTILDNKNVNGGYNGFHENCLKASCDIHIGDICDYEAVKECLSQKDILFNLAAETSHLGSMQNPAIDFKVNVLGQLNILEYVRRHNKTIKIINAGTRQIYGPPIKLPVTEKHPIKPVDINGISKYSAEMVYELYSKIYGIRSCVVRLTNTYGPGMRIRDAKQMFLGVWIRNVINSDPIAVFGNGCQIRDFSYVKDCAEALLLTGTHKLQHWIVFNVGSKAVHSLNEVAEMMLQIEGVESKIEHIPFPKSVSAIDIGSYIADFKKIENELGWYPKTSLKEGLNLTLKYYKTHFKEYMGKT